MKTDKSLFEKKLIRQNEPVDEHLPFLVLHRTNPGADQRKKQFHFHQVCEMGIALHGSYLRIHESETFTVKRGGVWWTGPWEPHGFQTLEDDSEAIVIECLPQVLHSFIPVLPEGSLIYSPFAIPEIRSRLQPQTRKLQEFVMDKALAIYREFAARGDSWEAIVRIEFVRLQVELLKAGRPGLAPFVRGESENQRIFKILEYIREHIAEKITLEKATGLAGLSRTSFIRFFKRHMGTAFNEYLVRCRVAGARNDLVASDYKLSYIARRWGFFNSSHMDKMFIRQTGRSVREIKAGGAPPG